MQMNTKPLCIASMIVSFLAACGLEGGGLSLKQVVIVLVPTLILLIWSFCQTDWYEPAEIEKVPAGAGTPNKDKR